MYRTPPMELGAWREPFEDDDDDDRPVGVRLGLATRTPDPDTQPDVVELPADVRRLVEGARSPATRRAYRADLADFTGWVAGRHPDRPAIPATPDLVAGYLAALVAETKTVSTIRRRLAAIRYAHELAGHLSPTTHPLVKAAAAGATRAAGRPVRQAEPLRLEDVRKIVTWCSPGSRRGRRDRALLLVGWAAALRRSELVGLDRDDLSVVDAGLIVTIRQSKTDQVRAGRTVVVPWVQNSSALHCPVKAVQALICDVPSGALFRSIDRWDRTGLRISADAVNVIVKQGVLARGIGDPANYSAHSLRAGYVTEMRARGATDAQVMRTTGHRTAAMLNVYDRPGDAFTSTPLTGDWW